MEFQRGDVVRLKSGGPRITVITVPPHEFLPEDHVECQWFDKKTDEPRHNSFPAEALEKASLEESSVQSTRVVRS